MTLVAKIDGVTLPDGALLIGGAPNSEVPGGISGLLTAAWYGEAPSVGITLDDPDGDLDSVLSLGSLHTFTVDETACTGKERIWSGWLTANRISRGPYRDGPSRIWDIDIIDMNWAFNLMAFRASSAKRPAETDIVRVAFGRASQPMSFTPLADNGRFNVTDNPVAFDEADYVARFPIELFASVAGTAGKNFYAYWDHDEEELSIHYDLVGVGPSSTLSISNVIADSSSTCFYPFLDAELVQDGAWKVTGMLFQYKGAYAYGIRQPTIDALSPTEFSPVEFQRDEVYSTDRVGKLATAQALIARMLEERAQDRDTITCSIRVPAEQVNLVEAGDVIGVKFTHLPGYEEEVDLPVIRRNVVPTPGRTDMYDIHLELTGNAKPTGPGGGGGGPFPPTTVSCDPDDVALVQAGVPALTNGSGHGGDGFIEMTDPPTPGNLIFLVFHNFEPTSTNGGITDVTGFTPITGELNEPDRGMQCSVWYRIVQSGDTEFITFEADSGGFGNRAAASYCEYSGVSTLDDFDTIVVSPEPPGPNPSVLSMGTVTPTSGQTALIVSFLIPSLDQNDCWNGVNLDSPLTEDTRYDTCNASRVFIIVGHDVVDGTSGSYSRSLTTTYPPGNNIAAWMTGTFAFLCDPSDLPTCPDAGQPNARPEVVTLSGADGTTLCPFSDGTLHVYIDNVEQTAKLVSQDGATGDFTLGFDPTPTEVCTVEYLGR